MKLRPKIFIYGVPGSGKTYFSTALQKKLGYALVEADSLRAIAQRENDKEENPFVYVSTTEAFREFGILNKENAIKGLESVRENMDPYVQKEITGYDGNTIIEGAFLDPRTINKLGQWVLIITSNEVRHRNHFFEHREENEENEESFKSARIIQDYLQEEAGSNHTKVFDNAGSIDDLVNLLE